MPKMPELQELLKCGVHFGHQSSRWHPKMEPYIYGVRNGIHIIDLEKTVRHMERALSFAKSIAARGGVILFVGTKEQAQEIVKKYAEDCGMPYVNQRWLGGLLTNFPVVLKLIKKYNDLKMKQQTGKLAKYTKKEQVYFDKQIVKMDNNIGGIAKLDKLPDAIFILDLKKEKTSFLEAVARNVPIIAVCDTNVNPADVGYPIPANDDATKSIDILFRLMSEAIKEGKAEGEKDVKKV